jgi:hypothetical protein
MGGITERRAARRGIAHFILEKAGRDRKEILRKRRIKIANVVAASLAWW